MAEHAVHGEGRCRNCGASLHGTYCAQCGQKRFDAHDRRFSHLVGEFFHGLTHVDSRFWRSVGALVFQPGRIPRDWIDGKRARWLAPVNLFLLANLLFFLSPGLSDLTLPLTSQVGSGVIQRFAPEYCQRTPDKRCEGWGQPTSFLTDPIVIRKLGFERAAAQREDREFSFDAAAARYQRKAESVGKLLVILHVPLIALALMWLAWRQKLYYAEHFVVALTLVTFMLVFAQFVMAPGERIYAWLGADATGGMPAFALFGFITFNLAYFVVAARRSYGAIWPMALLQGFAAFCMLVLANMLLYRPMQLLVSLLLM